MASGSTTSIRLNQVVRVSVDLPHPFGPATTNNVGMYGGFARAGQGLELADFPITRSPRRVRAM